MKKCELVFTCEIVNVYKKSLGILKMGIRHQTYYFFSNFVIINNAPAWINFDEGRVIMDGTNVYFTETHLQDQL
jgi:hypothetical protein